MWGNCKPIVGSHAVESMGWISSYLDRRPLPRGGGGERGGGRCARGYLGSVSVRSTDDALASFVSSTASDRKGFVKGESVPLDRVLPTFARTKVGPRRVGVQVMPLQKAPRRRRREETIIFFNQPLSHGCAVPPPFAQGRLEVSATPHSLGFWLAVLLKYHIAVITLSKSDISKKGFFCVTHN